MDVTASISDGRSLSQSDLILRSLFSTLQVGSTCRAGRGILIQGASFKSGTLENPLIVTLKNSQTETVMYVRNIPMNVVLERGGLHDHWVAVYPPGDPQNLHFDGASVPKEGVPAVCISVSIVEDLSNTVVMPSPGRGSVPFDPAPRGSLLQEDLARARQRVDGLGSAPVAAPAAMSTGDASARPGGGFPGGGYSSSNSRTNSRGMSGRLSRAGFGSAGELNDPVQDVNAKAQQIKENLSKMRSASLQAKESSSRLSEQRRKAENLKQQLHSLTQQVAELRAATQMLQRNRDALRAEEAQLLEQAQDKERVFQELRRSRDEMDAEIERALGEGEKQRWSLEASSRDFGQQRRTMAEDIDQSQSQVAALRSSLQSREEAAAQLEQQIRQDEEKLAAEDAAERERMRALLDQTRSSLAAARSDMEDHKRRLRAADTSLQETSMRINSVEGESSTLRAAVEEEDDGGEMVRATTTMAADLDAKVKAHIEKVKRLEDELAGNRAKLDSMNDNITELHSEAHDMQLAAIRCEDERTDIEQQMEAKRSSAVWAEEQNRLLEEQLQEAEAELARSQEELRSLELAEAEGRDRHAQAASELQAHLGRLREEQHQARAEADELQRECEDLESRARDKRAQVDERDSDIAQAQARVEELTRDLSAAAAEMAALDEQAKPARQELARSQAQLEAARKRTRERREDILSMQREAEGGAAESSTRLAELDETRASARQDLESFGEAGRAFEHRRAELQGSLARSEDTIARIQKDVSVLLAAKQDGEDQVRALAQQREAVHAELQRGAAELAGLEEARQERSSDLETSKRAADAKHQEASELEAQNRADIEQMEAAAAELSAAHAERQRLVGRLDQELEEVRSALERESQRVASEHRERSSMEAEVARLASERSSLSEAVQDTLCRTEQGLQEATRRVQAASQGREEAAERLREAQGRREALGSRAALARSEADDEATRASEAELELNQRRSALQALRRELELAGEEAAALEARGASAEAELASSRAQVQAVENAHTEVEELQRRHAALVAEERAEEEQQAEALAERERQAAASREELERTRQGLVRKKEEEISRQAMQIGKLEEERRGLLAQALRSEEERHELEKGLQARTEARQDVLADTRRKATDCDELESTVSGLKVASAQLRETEAEMGQKLKHLREREETLRQESQERERQMRDLRLEMEESDRQAAAQVEECRENMKEHIQSKASHEREVEELKRRLADATDEVAALVRDSSLADGRADELEGVLGRTRTELQEALAERDAKRRAVQEQAAQMAPRSGAHAHGDATLEVSRAASAVRELESRLQALSERLVGAQETVRLGHAREEELRVDYQKAKETLKCAEDKMAYQMEHDRIQRDTIQSMLEQKAKADQEIEVFVMGIHEAEQRNAALQQANAALQGQVEELYKGSLQDWAEQVTQELGTSPEAIRARDEIEAWRQRAEQLRKDKAAELGRLQREHEEAVQRLRARVAAAQAELDSADRAVQRREAALAKRREHGEAVTAPGGVPGLTVPQRVLPRGHQRRKALLIGINYPQSHAPLKGCVNDVWHLHCLLRYTLQYSEDQMRMLVDTDSNAASRPSRAPTKANILEGLQWLTDGAQPGDNLLLVFCGYSTQHPTIPGSDLCEGYLVPADFAADLPADFLSASSTTAPSRSPPTQDIASTPGRLDLALPILERSFASPIRSALTPRDTGASYRLVSLLELNEFICRLPKICRMSVVLDCCYGGVPNVNPVSGLQPRFPKVTRGRVDHVKLRDFISRPRFLELPFVHVQHTPVHLLNASPQYPACWVHVFAGCELNQWCAEFPIEGTVQGAFSWAFMKALAQGHFHCGLYQFQQMLAQTLASLKSHFSGIDMTPVLQLSAAASMQDVVLWT